MEKIQYKTTDKFTQEVIEEIVSVKKENGLTAENLLEKAKSEDSSLHDMFDWDNNLASEKWRTHQARLIINQVEIIVEDKTMYNFEIVNVKVKDEDGEIITKKEYKSQVDIMNNKEYRNQIICAALDSITYWQQKYHQYKELKPICVSIEKAKQEWQKKQ